MPAPQEVAEVHWLTEPDLRSRSDLLGSIPDFFFAKDAIVKKYVLFGGNKEQIICEIANYLKINGQVPGVPRMLDYELGQSEAAIVLEKLPGTLLCDVLPNLSESQKFRIAQQVVTILVSLERCGLHHNDLRTWNILHTGEQVHVLDLGLASPIPTERNVNSFLCLLWAMHTCQREGFAMDKEAPSDRPQDYGASFAKLARQCSYI